jgi:hypothetical protein
VHLEWERIIQLEADKTRYLLEVVAYFHIRPTNAAVRNNPHGNMKIMQADGGLEIRYSVRAIINMETVAFGDEEKKQLWEWMMTSRYL